MCDNYYNTLRQRSRIKYTRIHLWRKDKSKKVIMLMRRLTRDNAMSYRWHVGFIITRYFPHFTVDDSLRWESESRTWWNSRARPARSTRIHVSQCTECGLSSFLSFTFFLLLGATFEKATREIARRRRKELLFRAFRGRKCAHAQRREKEVIFFVSSPKLARIVPEA